jgi:hypothetical protein
MTAAESTIIEETAMAFEDEVIPAIEDALVDCAPYVAQWRLDEVRRAVEILESFKVSLDDQMWEANV